MNGLTPPKSGAIQWPPGPTPRASRGAPEPSEDFAGILDSHQARTANAEGQDRSSRTEERDRRDDDPVANDRAEARSNARWARERREADGIEREHPVHQHDADHDQPTTGDAAGDPEPTASDTPQAGDAQQAPASDVLTVSAQAAPVAVEATEPAQGADAPVQQQKQQPAEAQPQLELPAAATAAAAPPQAPVQPNQLQQQVAGDAPEAQAPVVATQPQQLSDSAAETAGSTDATATTAPQPDAKPAADRAPQPNAPAGAPGKPASNGGDQAQQGQQQREPGTLPQPAADPARTVAQAYGRAQHTSTEVPTTAQSGTPAASSVTPVAGGPPVAARAEFATATAVPLSHAAENVEHVLRLAAARGVTHARIALNPASLGSIDVHLRHTSDGVVAHVVAHAPEAVQQLQQAAADLRSHLEAQGVNLLSLDIGHSAGDGRSAGRAGTGFGDEAPGNGRGHADGDEAAPVADAETTVNSTLQLPNGVLVDVLA